MTQDELEKQAEEYFCEHCENGFEHGHGWCSNCSKWDNFIAGVKCGVANAIEWHDLRKDPNDLPKLENKDFLWSIIVANQLGEACHYNYRKSRWETPLFTKMEGVITWCELPQFKDKE